MAASLADFKRLSVLMMNCCDDGDKDVSIVAANNSISLLPGPEHNAESREVEMSNPEEARQLSQGAVELYLYRHPGLALLFWSLYSRTTFLRWADYKLRRRHNRNPR